jgi:hypothetical protein
MIKFTSRLNLAGSRVDRQRGVIKGVSLIALGQARGHGKGVDQKTLETVRDCAQKYGDGLRVKFNPSTFTHGAGTLAGRIPPNTIRIEDNKTVGDLHLYQHLPQDYKNYLFEIAEETPANIGLSIEFSGDDEVIEENKFARCEEIFAATIVDLPAANPTGLFSEDSLTKLKDEHKSATSEDTDMTDEDITKLATATAKATVEALTPVIQKFAEGNGNGNGKAKEHGEDGKDDDAEEMAAAGVTDGDDAKTKAEKLAAYRNAMKPVSAMSAAELIKVVKQGDMQFFRETGNRPVKTNAEPTRTDVDPFEKRIKQNMESGASSRGLAIARARRDAPKEYNEWMAKKHPGVQHLEAVRK